VTAASYAIRLVNGTAPPVVVVTGEIDVTNVSDFVVSTDEVPGDRPLVLDLSDLVYLDSAGLATLDRLAGANSAVVVIPPSSPMFRAAELMDLPRHATVEEALGALGVSSPPA
jgi:anti-sigma B factor antagonist